MMKLYWSSRSPFVRKVMIVLHEAGMRGEVECIGTLVSGGLPPNPAVLANNPLGKIPTLMTDDGRVLFDSRVICEFIDMRAGTGLFPDEADARIRHLRWQALADGLADILIAWRTELARPGGPWRLHTDGWLIRVRAIMRVLEEDAAALRGEDFGIGHIAVACALGQLDFRWSDCGWRGHFPALAVLETWLSARPSIAATPVVDDQPPGPVDLTAGLLTFDG